jgi:hypothetical protein
MRSSAPLSLPRKICSVTDLHFIAEVYKVQTLVDNGLRVTLDLPESAIPAAAALMEAKRREYAVRVTVTVLSRKEKIDDDTEEEE